MKFHPLKYDNSSEENINYNSIIIMEKGGNPKNIKDVLQHTSTGSFPPIYMLTKEDIKKEEEQNKTRGFSSINKTAVSIKEIMQERNDNKKPFIIL